MEFDGEWWNQNGPRSHYQDSCHNIVALTYALLHSSLQSDTLHKFSNNSSGVWCFWHYYYSHLNRWTRNNWHPLAPMSVKETSSEYQSCARIGKETEHRVAGTTESQWRGNQAAKGYAEPFINWSWERGHRGMEDGTTARGTRANIPPNVETPVSDRHLHTVVQLILWLHNVQSNMFYHYRATQCAWQLMVAFKWIWS